MQCPVLASALILIAAAAAALPAPAAPLPSWPKPEPAGGELARRSQARRDGPDGAAHDNAPIDGVVVLDEEVVTVDPSGATTITEHRVLEVATVQGVARAERVVVPYRPETQRLEVVLARRITPAGERLPVPAEAVLREKPQPLADRGIYADIEQLVLLFPAVRPGDRIEYTLRREVDPVMPGEYSAFLPVADPWPTASARRELVLPAGWADRLRATLLDLAPDQQGRTPLADGRTSVWWWFADRPPLVLEADRQPIRQGGPGIWLSTVAGWEEVARWYEGLLADCDVLDPALRRQVADWTDGLDDPPDILAALCRQLASRTRYLGLELGESALRPRPASEVWASGFGDCKELSNLLRAMLASRGVAAYLLLLNSRHAGRLELATPSPLQFDHVVLAVDDGRGGLTVCDPTAPDLPPGELLPTVGGRRALVVGSPDRTFLDLPPASAGTLSAAFELQLTPRRELYGWLALDTDTAQSSILVRQLLATAGEARLAAAQALLATFFPEPTVLDLMVPPGDLAGPPRSVRIYFRTAADGDRRGVLLTVPTSGLLLPAACPSERRETPHFQSLGTTTISATVRLPAGWRALGPAPDPLAVATGELTVAASWRHGDDAWTGVLEHRNTGTLVEPAAFVALSRARAAALRWLQTPLLVGPGASAAAAVAEPLPRLPTGAGQLRLVNAMFPAGLDPDGRRVALERVSEWFAADPATALEAGIELAVLEQEAGRPARSVERLTGLLQRHGGQVAPDLKGWAEYLLASGLRESGRHEEARDLYDRLSRQPDLAPHRRGWAAARAAAMRLGSDPLTALAILTEAVELDSPALEQQASLLVRILLRLDGGTAADAALAALGERHPHRTLDVHARLLEDVRRALDEADLERATALVVLLESRVAGSAELALLAAEVTTARRLLESSLACREIAAAVRGHFARQPPAWWAATALPEGDRDRLVATLQRLDRDEDAHAFVRLAVEVATRFPVAPDFFGFLLWRCAYHLDAAGGETGLRDRFLDWCSQLPDGD